jgi:hypothetical protein
MRESDDTKQLRLKLGKKWVLAMKGPSRQPAQIQQDGLPRSGCCRNRASVRTCRSAIGSGGWPVSTGNPSHSTPWSPWSGPSTTSGPSDAPTPAFSPCPSPELLSLASIANVPMGPADLLYLFVRTGMVLRTPASWARVPILAVLGTLGERIVFCSQWPCFSFLPSLDLSPLFHDTSMIHSRPAP